MSIRVFGGLIPENVVRATTDATGDITNLSAGGTEISIDSLPKAIRLASSIDGAAISLASGVSGVWFPMDEGAGTTITDRINGIVATVAGTTTNLWSVAGMATFDANTYFKKANDSILDGIYTLSTLSGSLIFGMEISTAANATANCDMASYGNTGSNTVGGLAPGLSTGTRSPKLLYCAVGGSTDQTAKTPSLYMLNKKKRFFVFAFHTLDGFVIFDCYESGYLMRSSRILPMEAAGALPVASPTIGLRIGCRATGVGGNAGYIGAAFTTPSMANYFALRIDGDRRGDIPGIIKDISNTMPYGVTPRIFQNA